MPWRGVTVTEERQRFLEDYRLNYYSVSELAERFGISRKTAHKWIARFEELGRWLSGAVPPAACPPLR
jgi:transposase